MTEIRDATDRRGGARGALLFSRTKIERPGPRAGLFDHLDAVGGQAEPSGPPARSPIPAEMARPRTKQNPFSVSFFEEAKESHLSLVSWIPELLRTFFGALMRGGGSKRFRISLSTQVPPSLRLFHDHSPAPRTISFASHTPTTLPRAQSDLA